MLRFGNFDQFTSSGRSEDQNSNLLEPDAISGVLTKVATIAGVAGVKIQIVPIGVKKNAEGGSLKNYLLVAIVHEYVLA